ncbi:MAG: NADH-quinone oxidoreductase subunit C [Ignavibacteria bacterium]|nr:NADH-quinone oxidoreductase subunit C [Ignavibacteria bacterium]
MKNPEEIFELLKSKFAEDVLELKPAQPLDAMIVVNPLKIKEISNYLCSEESLSFDTLMCLSGVDDANGEKVKDGNGIETINGGTLSIYYHLDSIKLRHKITIKISVPRDNPETYSVESIWKCADWHEREAYDLFGIKFLDHPDLRRILLPDDWDGFPLRKDYQVPEFYLGMKVPY